MKRLTLLLITMLFSLPALAQTPPPVADSTGTPLAPPAAGVPSSQAQPPLAPYQPNPALARPMATPSSPDDAAPASSSPPIIHQQISFPDWMNELRHDAIAQGIRPTTVYYALGNVYPDPAILQKDREQPENKETAQEYWDKMLDVNRIERGREFYSANRDLLRRISEAYGVRTRYLVALLGIESNYGEGQGNENIINSLVTLAYDGRRSEYFRDELIAAMQILDQGNVRIEKMRGSWAGALGYCQFMPSNYLKYGQDFDGDGRVDIWSSVPDAVASTAYYLHRNGWQVAEEWGQEVTLRKPVDPELMGAKVRKSLREWRKLGVREKGGKKLPQNSTMASLLQPDGPEGRSFLVYNNFHVLTRWNRSTYFAVAVGMLADILGMR
ncbi:MAG: lytic murein transglycosylase [Proteobacteria bacterium]|nr:lytic murein transglycosylase [Pseudomonadota bacterium]